MADPKPRDKIQPPRSKRGADITRAGIKGVMGMVPGAGSLLAEAADLFLPDPTGRDRERWEGAMTEGVNHLQGRVDALDERLGADEVTFSGAVADVARFMIKHCPEGLMRDDITVDMLVAACPDHQREQIIEALDELQSYGLVSRVDFMNDDGFYNLTAAAYDALDPPIMGWGPMEDARRIAELAVAPERSDGANAPELNSVLGWPRRRFNPAYRVVLGLVDEGAIDTTCYPHYDALGFYLNGADRARLRRFAAGK